MLTLFLLSNVYAVIVKGFDFRTQNHFNVLQSSLVSFGSSEHKEYMTKKIAYVLR